MDTRPPPPQGAPPSYAFVTRVYRRNLRPVVMAVAFLAGIWTLFSAVGFFRSAGIDGTQNFPKLETFSIAMGALYITVCVIEGFGLLSAATQRLVLVRIYAYLSAFVILIVAGAGLTRTVMHFTMKTDIIKECTILTNGDSIVYFGFWGPVSHSTLDEADAEDWCNRAWSHDSWSEVVSLLLTTLLATLFASVAFAYFRQVLDPTSPANAARRAPSSQIRMDGFPSHYQPPYNASVPNLGYGYNAPYQGQPYQQQSYQPYQGQPGAHQPYGSQQYGPPPGAPPLRDDAFAPPYDGKPPGYDGSDGKVGAGYGEEKDDDPFGNSRPNGTRDERDVTSRPGPGGREGFM